MDAGATARLGPRLDWELNATVLRARADRGAAPFRRLTQRPGFELYTALDWRPAEALSLRKARVVHRDAVELASW